MASFAIHGNFIECESGWVDLRTIHQIFVSGEAHLEVTLAGLAGHMRLSNISPAQYESVVDAWRVARK